MSSGSAGMATKQLLQDFQSRLAERLQSARTAGVTAGWLAVEVSGSRLLFPLTHAGEIFSWAQVQSVPYAHDWFLGMANLRGGLCGIVDLASFMAGGERSRPEASLSQGRLVALNPVLEVNCALLVDRLLGLRTTDAFVASDPPSTDAPPYFSHVFLDHEGGRWQEINLQALSQNPAFLSIGA